MTATFEPSTTGSRRISPPVTTTVGRDGKWQIRITVAAPQRPGRITITAVVVAPGGARSEPTRTVLLWTPPGEPGQQ